MADRYEHVWPTAMAGSWCVYCRVRRTEDGAQDECPVALRRELEAANTRAEVFRLAADRAAKPRYAIGIDHGTDPSTSVVAQIGAGNIKWVVDEPGDVDDGPRVFHTGGVVPPGAPLEVYAVTGHAIFGMADVDDLVATERRKRRATVIKSSAPLAFDDELDEEERGVSTPWSDTWDG